MKITNETVYDTRGIRALVIACEKWMGMKGKWCGRLRVGYARRGGFAGGYAYYHGGSIALFIPHPFPAHRPGVMCTRRNENPDGTVTVTPVPWPDRLRVDEAGVMLPATFNDCAWTLEHEMMHTANWTHRQMRGHPAHHGRADRPPVWAEGMTLRVKPAHATKAKATPEARAEAARQRAAARGDRDREALARWQTKLKLATTKVRNLRRKIAARERRTNAR